MESALVILSCIRIFCIRRSQNGKKAKTCMAKRCSTHGRATCKHDHWPGPLPALALCQLPHTTAGVKSLHEARPLARSGSRWPWWRPFEYRGPQNSQPRRMQGSARLYTVVDTRTIDRGDPPLPHPHRPWWCVGVYLPGRHRAGGRH